MRKVIIATLLTVVLVVGVLLIDRSIRMNRAGPEGSASSTSKILPSSVELVNFGTNDRVKFAKFSGKIVLVNFWASWCEACMAEMPSIQKLYDRYKKDGLEVVAINVDDDPQKVVPQIVKALHLSFPIFIDPKGELQPFFNVVAIPYSLVADRNQKVLWADSGERDWDSPAVVEDIGKLLKKI